MQGPKVDTYSSIFSSLWPLAAISFVLTFGVGLHHVKAGYLCTSKLAMVGNLLFSSSFGACLAVGIACVTDYFLPEASLRLQVGIAIFIGLFGTKGLDLFFLHILRLKIVDKDAIQSIMEDKK